MRRAIGTKLTENEPRSTVQIFFNDELKIPRLKFRLSILQMETIAFERAAMQRGGSPLLPYKSIWEKSPFIEKKKKKRTRKSLIRTMRKRIKLQSFLLQFRRFVCGVLVLFTVSIEDL